MSLPLDLDEYTDDVLEREVARRIAARRQGRCSYCGRLLTDTPCRMRRHRTDNVKRIGTFVALTMWASFDQKRELTPEERAAAHLLDGEPESAAASLAPVTS